MNKRMGLFVVAALCVGACNVEHYDDCSRDDDWQFEDDFETGHRAGTTGVDYDLGGADDGSNATGGTNSSGTNSSGTNSGGTNSSGGTDSGAAGAPEPMLPPVTPCDKERDCDAGFNCNLDAHECQPAELETCAEMEGEAECAARNDCIAVYGGINCSCGVDCECQGGEPGCICESFEYLLCQPVE